MPCAICLRNLIRIRPTVLVVCSAYHFTQYIKHVFQMFSFLPETKEAVANIAAFISQNVRGRH
jgi:hypothetical protein